MFDNPVPMIWNYLLKNDGTKKARCVADGSPRQKGSITLANTYTARLKQPGSHMFWGIIAIKIL